MTHSFLSDVCCAVGRASLRAHSRLDDFAAAFEGLCISLHARKLRQIDPAAQNQAVSARSFETQNPREVRKANRKQYVAQFLKLLRRCPIFDFKRVGGMAAFQSFAIRSREKPARFALLLPHGKGKGATLLFGYLENIRCPEGAITFNLCTSPVVASKNEKYSKAQPVDSLAVNTPIKVTPVASSQLQAMVMIERRVLWNTTTTLNYTFAGGLSAAANVNLIKRVELSKANAELTRELIKQFSLSYTPLKAAHPSRNC